MVIDSKYIYKLGICLLLLPTFLFCGFFLKPIYAIFATGILICVLYFSFTRITEYFDEYKVTIKKKYFLIVCMFNVSITLVSGIGGFFPQSADYIVRNPVFYDLIFFKWPVVYEDTNSSLVYYIGYFLLPALLGKLFNFVGDNNFAWKMANLMLVIQTSIYLVIVNMLIMIKLHITEKKQKFIIVIPILVMSFTGLHIIAYACQLFLIKDVHQGSISFLVEWYVPYAYNGIFVAIIYTFNQIIPSLLSVLLFLNTKNSKLYLLIGLSLLISSPLPLIGLCIIMIIFTILQKGCNIKEVIVSSLSVANLLFLIVALIVFSYFLGHDNISVVFYPIIQDKYSLIKFINFCTWEFGIVGFILYKRNKNNSMFWISILLLTIIPFFRFSNAVDFSLRVSTAPIIILMVLFCEYVYSNYHELKQESTYIFACHFITICCLMLFIRLSSHLQYIPQAGRFDVQINPVQSFSTVKSRLRLWFVPQYIKRNPEDNFFWKKLSKANLQNIRTPDIVIDDERNVQAVVFQKKDIPFLAKVITGDFSFIEQQTYTEGVHYYYPKNSEITLNESLGLVNIQDMEYHIEPINLPERLPKAQGLEWRDPYHLNILFINKSKEMIVDASITNDIKTSVVYWFEDENQKKVTTDKYISFEFNILPEESVKIDLPLLEVPANPGVYNLVLSLFQDQSGYAPRTFSYQIVIY